MKLGKLGVVVAAAGVLLVAGCTTTQMAQNYLDSNYVGKNMDEFVLKYGPPFGKFQLNNGDVLYSWSSEVKNYAMPATTTVSGTNMNGYVNATATTWGGGSVSVYCKVNLVVGPDGVIKSLKPTADTIGKWTTSRCGEFFADKPIQ